MICRCLLLCLLAACGPAHRHVAPISLHDSQLPVEARRWLADAEDEVSIARARLDDAQVALARQSAYAQQLDARASQLRGGDAVASAVQALSGERISLRRLQLSAAEHTLRLALAHLDLIRAETAMRHDLAVYDTAPLADKVDRLRDEVAAAERTVEEHRAGLDQSTDALWAAYSAFVNDGGHTEPLWGTP